MLRLLKNVDENQIKIIAVDFDGTLCVREKFPQIGSPKLELINWLINQKENGKKIILWSCREDDNLRAAIEWCRNYGLVFDAVNENLSSIDISTRKVFADLYIDDRACIPTYEESQ